MSDDVVIGQETDVEGSKDENDHQCDQLTDQDRQSLEDVLGDTHVADLFGEVEPVEPIVTPIMAMDQKMTSDEQSAHFSDSQKADNLNNFAPVKQDNRPAQTVTELTEAR